jgi:uncharacterized protein YciI|tara:strand:+ start:71272 stop:71571 length:300 start_codon:yes stop_codon:yes gene_type:complete
MWYVIIGKDIEDSLQLRMKTRDSHLARLNDLTDQGRILVAGPIPAIDNEDPGEAGFSGSIIIAEFKSLQDAEDWANQDPYVKAGVFSEITVKPFKKVLP